MFNWITNVWVALPVLVVMSYLVSVASDKLGDVLHITGLKLNIPTSVRGATFDAIASSFPEFATAMIAVLLYHKFNDVGVATVAGSGIFNILLIPLVSILAFKGVELNLKVKSTYVYRDMIFYLISIITLFIFTYIGYFNIYTGLILLLIYAAYIYVLYLQTKDFRDNQEEQEELEEDMSYWLITFWIVIAMAIIWISIDAIIASALVIADAIHVPPFIVSVVVIAAATSIPDTLLSVKSARKGDADGAISNAVGSNIFDICVGLGIPMVIAGRTIEVQLSQNAGMFGFLLISMFTTGVLLLKKKGMHKKDAAIMGIVYLAFIVYVVMKAING